MPVRIDWKLEPEQNELENFNQIVAVPTSGWWSLKLFEIAVEIVGFSRWVSATAKKAASRWSASAA